MNAAAQVQFVVGMSHAAQSLYIGCPFPLWMHWALIIYGISIFALFINFYLHAYVKPRKARTTCDQSSKIKKLEEERATVECTNGKVVIEDDDDCCYCYCWIIVIIAWIIAIFDFSFMLNCYKITIYYKHFKIFK